MTRQPQWKCIARLGDADPVSYGGYFVYIDETGVYPPKAEKLFEPSDDQDLDDPKARWTVYRFILEPCTFEDGVLSDNPYHRGFPVWFADKLAGIAAFVGQTELQLITSFCSVDPVDRAFAWQAVGDYHGYENLDSYPLQLTQAEAEARYGDVSIKA